MPGEATARAAPAGPAGSASIDKDLLPDEADLPFEEELLRNPHEFKSWWRYIEARKDATARKRYLLYERALRHLPGSYKLWHAYLQERLVVVRGSPPRSPLYESLNNTFERALVTMHKMPRIWEMFLRFLLEQRLVTRTRRACDRALAALPVTQHERVWTIFLAFIRQPGIPVDTALRVYRRYLKLEPGHAEEYVEFLRSRGHWNEAAERLADIVNDDMFVSLAGKTKHQLWLELCDIITKHPAEISTLPVEAILRGGIRKFTDEVGRLWVSLADFFIRRGLFEKARDVYEEGVNTVVTVRDFDMIFNAYTQFEDSMITAKMEAAGADADPEDIPPEEFLLKDTGDDLELRLARLENLAERRPELLSSVMLRQNPHNVIEWLKRVGLFEGNPTRQILTFTEAVKTVQPDKAVGRPPLLWVAFARFYEDHGDVDNARVIFDKATAAPFKAVDDLAHVWCEWAEMELRHKQFSKALELMRRATEIPDHPRHAGQKFEELPVQFRVHKSLKVWNFFCDLEESLGTLESSRRVYDQMLELKVATPQTVLNYAALLSESKFWEDSFSVYERGVNLFRWPHCKDIWLAYLREFAERYGGKKLERSRDLFEQALSVFPADACKEIYLAYATLEEEHGLARHAMAVLSRAVRAVPDAEKLAVVELYAAKAQDYFGVGKVRAIFEECIEMEPPLAAPLTKALCVKFAQLERKLGEIDRARALFVHASQFSNPAQDREFWDEWNGFEVRHGNEDTFREMLRIKRSVTAAFSNMHFNMAVIEIPTATGELEAGGAVPVEALKRAREEDAMAGLEQAAAAQAVAAAMGAGAGANGLGRGLSMFVSAGITGGSTGGSGQPAANAEEINLDDDDDDMGGEGAGGEAAEPDVDVEQKAVPDAVFGGVKEAAAKAAAAAAAAGDEPPRKKQRG